MMSDGTKAAMNLFLVDCNGFSISISELSTSLNEKKINELNINNDINFLIDKITKLKKYKDKLDLDDENKKKVNEVFDKLKKDFVSLKNKHIAIYNEKVQYINDKIDSLISSLNRDKLLEHIKKIVDGLEKIEICELYINREWDQNEYLKSLQYDKLNKMYDDVILLEKKLNIHDEEPIGLYSLANYIEYSLEVINKDLNKDLSGPEIITCLSRCITLLERVIDLDIKRDFIKRDISINMYDLYGKRIEKIRKRLEEVELKVWEKRRKVIKKSNNYSMISDEIEFLGYKYDVLDKKVLEYTNKCNVETPDIIRSYLVQFNKVSDEIKSKIENCRNNGMLNEEQLNNLNKKISYIKARHKDIEMRAVKRPTLVRDEDKEKYDSKCPLLVKSVRSVKELYKKHKKLGLIAAGLSSLALLFSAFSLIPAIMYGNSIIAVAIPGLSGMMNMFNKILGGVSGATFKNGIWKLASGAILNAKTASTALLKSIAMFGSGVVAFLSPLFVPQLLEKIKKLIEKMKKFELTEKVVNVCEKGIGKVKEESGKVKSIISDSIEKQRTKKYYEMLYDEYCRTNMKLDDFCKSKNLEPNEIELLRRFEKKDEKLNELINEKIKKKRKLMGGE